MHVNCPAGSRLKERHEIHQTAKDVDLPLKTLEDFFFIGNNGEAHVACQIGMMVQQRWYDERLPKGGHCRIPTICLNGSGVQGMIFRALAHDGFRCPVRYKFRTGKYGRSGALLKYIRIFDVGDEGQFIENAHRRREAGGVATRGHVPARAPLRRVHSARRGYLGAKKKTYGPGPDPTGRWSIIAI